MVCGEGDERDGTARPATLGEARGAKGARPVEPMIVGSLIAVMLLGLVMWLLAWDSAKDQSGGVYPFAVPYMWQAAASAIVALLGLYPHRLRALCLVVSSALVALLGLPFWHSLMSWWGEDDAGTLGWWFIVGIGTATCFLVGTITSIVGVAGLLRRGVPGRR